MSTRGPIFNLIPINLTVAGSKDINASTSAVMLVRADDASGNLSLDAKVMVQLGDIMGDAIPMGVNCTAHLRDPTAMVRFTWEAQPGVTAYFLLSANDSLVVNSPPAKQMVVSSGGTALVAAAAFVGGAAPTRLAAASAKRQSVTIQNLGSLEIYVGGVGVTSATGIMLNGGGGVMVIEKTTADIWAVPSSPSVGGSNVRVLREE